MNSAVSSGRRLASRVGLGLFALAPLVATFAVRAELPADRTSVRDHAGFFSAGAIAKANERLERVERDDRVPIVIETVDSLEGQSIDEATLRRAKREISEGVFVLIAKQESKIEVVASPKFRELFPLPVRVSIRDAFIAGFKEGRNDRGLANGIDAISGILAKLREQGKLSVSADSHPDGAGGAGDSPLVLRNQSRLTLAGARAIVAGCERKAAELKLRVNIAVVDDGGHMLSFARMDGARPASGYTATTKAVTAATFRAPSGPLPTGSTSPDPLLNLSLQNAAAVSGGKITTLLGGVPVEVDGQVIGAVGVGGGTGEQDAEVARAGVEAFRKEARVGTTATRPAPVDGDAQPRKDDATPK